jgi:L-fuconolactonase
VIVDPHHHLWDRPGWRYLLDDILADIRTGHDVRATVFVQARAMHRADGPEAMKPVGETEFANGIAAMSASGAYGEVRVCAGIVGFADLRLGDARCAPVLEGACGGGRRAGGGASAASATSPPGITDPAMLNPAYTPAEDTCWTARPSAPASRISRRSACPSTPGSTSTRSRD